jgi:Secretion system C-terminal sorting domain
MRTTIIKNQHWFKAAIVSFFLCCTVCTKAQTTLNAGDIAIIGLNYDAVPQEMSIVTLVSIASGTTIRITDYGYDETTSTFGLTSVANTSEGSITWTTTAAIQAGTVIKFSIAPSVSGPVVSGLPGTVSATGWTNTNALNCPSSAGGDNWFIFQGSSPTSVSRFVFAWTNPFALTFNSIAQPAGQFIVPGSGTPNNGNSYLPNTLSLGTNAISLSKDPANSGYHGDDNVYTGTRTGTKANLLASICTIANWSTNELATYNISAGGTYFPGTNPIFTILSIVPLKWINVSASLNLQQKAVISWEVQETDAARYEIEKSTNGRNFTTITSLNSKADGIHSYEFAEPEIYQGTVFYRIKQVDKDGQYSYSVVLSVVNNRLLKGSVYPNPARNLAQVNVSNLLIGTTAELIDINGKKIKNIAINKQNFAGLNAGIYLLKFVNGQTEKLIVE